MIAPRTALDPRLADWRRAQLLPRFLLLKRAQILAFLYIKWAYQIWSVSHLISKTREVTWPCSSLTSTFSKVSYYRYMIANFACLIAYGKLRKKSKQLHIRSCLSARNSAPPKMNYTWILREHVGLIMIVLISYDNANNKTSRLQYGSTFLLSVHIQRAILPTLCRTKPTGNFYHRKLHHCWYIT